MTGERSAHYVGEAIDPRSRRRVRQAIDFHMKTDWKTWWTKGVSNYSRNKLVFECLQDLDAYWFGRNEADNACFSAQAVAEEIDYYLPKSFWKHKRGKRRSAGQVMVDPDWKTFKGWRFEYPETVHRLKAEYEAMRKRSERRKPWE